MKNYKVIYMIDGEVNEAYFKTEKTANKFYDMVIHESEMCEMREKKNDMWELQRTNHH